MGGLATAPARSRRSKNIMQAAGKNAPEAAWT
jgi:hypothetical protein